MPCRKKLRNTTGRHPNISPTPPATTGKRPSITRPEGETPGDQSDIFHNVRTKSSLVLEAGHDVIVDAMHIEPEHRIRQLLIAPPDVKIKYVIIDRPLEEKQRDAGWRARKGVVEKYHHLFADHVSAALRGDGRPDVQVVDLRSLVPTSSSE
jgi:hypothetical protein